MDVVDPLLQVKTELVGDVGVLWVDGEVDHGTAPLLRRYAEAMLGDGSRSLVFDLGHVSYLDSSGLNVLIRAQNHARELGGTVTVRYASEQVRRVMEVAGLNAMLVPPPEDGDPARR